jgi:hypothetical protein
MHASLSQAGSNALAMNTTERLEMPLISSLSVILGDLQFVFAVACAAVASGFKSTSTRMPGIKGV